MNMNFFLFLIRGLKNRKTQLFVFLILLAGTGIWLLEKNDGHVIVEFHDPRISELQSNSRAVLEEKEMRRKSVGIKMATTYDFEEGEEELEDEIVEERVNQNSLNSHNTGNRSSNRDRNHSSRSGVDHEWEKSIMPELEERSKTSINNELLKSGALLSDPRQEEKLAKFKETLMALEPMSTTNLWLKEADVDPSILERPSYITKNYVIEGVSDTYELPLFFQNNLWQNHLSQIAYVPIDTLPPAQFNSTTFQFPLNLPKRAVGGFHLNRFLRNIMPRLNVFKARRRCGMDVPGCFDLERCDPENIKLYFYPVRNIKNNFLRNPYSPTDDVRDMTTEANLQRNKRYFSTKAPHFSVTENPDEACLFIPPTTEDGTEQASAWKNLTYWRGNGNNHVLFVLSPKLKVVGDPQHAIIAKTSWSMRHLFTPYTPFWDIELPLPPLNFMKESGKPIPFEDRDYLVSFMGKRYTKGEGTIERNSLRLLLINETDSTLFRKHGDKGTGDIVRICLTCAHLKQPYDENCRADMSWYYNSTVCDYDDLAINSKYGLSPKGRQFACYRTAELMVRGTIPVMIGDEFLAPYLELMDWSEFSIYFHTSDTIHIPSTLRAISTEQAIQMSKRAQQVAFTHFSSISRVIHTALETIRQRIIHFKK